MNIGLYQSASALSALERWQDSVSENITSAQTTGFRKRTVNFSTVNAGELNAEKRGKAGHETGMAMNFPKVNYGINFLTGETQPTRREFDVAIQGDGFFEAQRPDGSKVYTRSGEFHIRADRTLVTKNNAVVMSDGGSPITLVAGGGPLTVNGDGTMFQGSNSLGKLSVKRFADTSALVPVGGGMFLNTGDAPKTVDEPELMQGYIEGSNVTPLREMVDLVLISRAYEANQKIIKTVDDQMEKTLNALG